MICCGNIIIDDLAKRIINTEEFQRLNIKQLGCCNYVFQVLSIRDLTFIRCLSFSKEVYQNIKYR